MTELTPKQQFMDALRRFERNTVARAMTAACPGVNFMGCSKGDMADTWVKAQTDDERSWPYGKLRGVTLDQLRDQCIKIDELGAATRRPRRGAIRTDLSDWFRIINHDGAYTFAVTEPLEPFIVGGRP